jgi:pimeloyl-ACP methyl ester carboxylesterase
LRKLSMHTLVIVGEQDDGFLKQSTAIAEAIPGARLEVIPGGGHSPQFEAPDAWWCVVRGFLDEVAAPRS